MSDQPLLLPAPTAEQVNTLPATTRPPVVRVKVKRCAPKRGCGPVYATDPVTGCWEWQRCINSDGYGYFRADRRQVLAHRWSYTKFKGPIPDGLDIDHLCRNRRCINPDHLETVTRGENVRRGRQTKLTVRQVDEIRVSRGKVTQKELALRYGVSPGLIGQIHTNRGWVGVGGAA